MGGRAARQLIAPMASKSGGALAFDASIEFDFELVAAPADVAELANTFFVIRSDEGVIEEVMPAYSAQLMIMLDGALVLRPGEAGADGLPQRSDSIACTAPQLAAAPITLEGPAAIVGVSLTALGWQALSGLPADEVHDCLVPAERFLARETREALVEAASGSKDESTATENIRQILCDALRASRSRLDPDHVTFVRKVLAWLASDFNPEISSLYETIAQSERTAQRLTKRYFGVPPSPLAKRYRAIRAAMLLANPELPQATRDALLAGYFDQAHLIRDIRRYTGRTPTGLTHESLVHETLDPEGHGEPARILQQRNRQD